jgi:hypothetical protein
MGNTVVLFEIVWCSTERRRMDYGVARSRIPSPVDQITTDS